MKPKQPLQRETAAKEKSGFGGTFVCSGADHEVSPGIWWRSVRFLRIRTSDDALLLQRAALLAIEYPFEKSNHWNSSDAEWDSPCRC